MSSRIKKQIPFYIIFSSVFACFFYFYSEKINNILTFFNLSFKPVNYAIFGFSIIWLVLLFSAFETSEERKGEEYGSARFGNLREYLKIKDSNKQNNFILSEKLRLSSNGRKTQINNNIYVVGGSGSGKTRFFKKPNLIQMRCSYVNIDPKATDCEEIGNAFKKNRYKIKYFNTIDFKKSMHYNPFEYLKEEKDILNLIETFIANTSGKGEIMDFFVKAEKLLYQALIGYIFYECPTEDHNFGGLLKLLNAITVSENENYKCEVDILFEELEEKAPYHFAVENYKGYKKAAGDTAKSILISTQARLSAFKINDVKEITRFDELELDKIGEEKTILFIMTDDKDPTYNFLIGILFTQLNIQLLNCADIKHGGRLPIPVEVYADELFNVCEIPHLEKTIAIMRSRLLSYAIVAQNDAQAKARYKDNASTVIGCCDTMLFLGSSEDETCKKISAKLDKQTIHLKNNSITKGRNYSSSYSGNTIGRELMTPGEVSQMATNKCINFMRGYPPFIDRKFDYTKHKNYKLTGDYNKKFMFKYWEHKNDDEDAFFTNVSEHIDLSILNDL